METGSHIGQYKVVGTLGQGGMGTVYLAEHVLLGRRAAIKTLRPELASQTEIVERFFNEARAVSLIADGGVVQIFDFGYHEDQSAYIVMELLEGETLADRMDRGLLSPSEALRITRQCAAALQAAHGKSIVHRDLKPENVFLVGDSEAQGGERAKVLDFGICKLDIPESKVHTQTGITMGTPVYMSPEQCRGAAAVDHRSDIYALGCVLFHMLTGEPPFDGDGSGDLIVAHVRDVPRAPSSIVSTIPPEVDAIVARCLDKDPAARFQSMDELRIACEQLQAYLSSPGEPVMASLPPIVRTERAPLPTTLGSSLGQIDLKAPRRRWLGGLGAAAVVIVLALFTVARTMDRPTTTAAIAPAVAALAMPAVPAPPPVKQIVVPVAAPLPAAVAAPVEVPVVAIPEPTPRRHHHTHGATTASSDSPTSTPSGDLYETR